MSSPILWLATSNKNKIVEFKELFSDLHFEIKTMADIQHPSPEETGKTFLENAETKLRAFQKRKAQAWVLAEDGGIEVDALDGRPGVYSGRYYKQSASWSERLKALLSEMKDIPQHLRTARMTSVILVGSPKGEVMHSEGVVEGCIASEIRGQKGFAYDWVFIPQGQEKTIGEMGISVKNQMSHRAIATKKMIRQLPSEFRSCDD